MKQTSLLRWRFVLLTILAVALVACERPVPRDDEPVPTTTPITVPTTAPVDVSPTAVPNPGEGYPADTGSTEAPTDTGDTTTEGETPADTGETAESPTPVPPAPTPGEDIVHTVAAGDTLYRIAQQYGVTIQSIVDANAITDPNALEVGQQLLITAGSGDSADTTTDPAAGATGERTHIVQSGENLFRIGLQYGFSAEELASYNGLTDATRIDVGQVIKIPPSE